MINQRFVVQLDRRTVGIAVRVPGGFAFYASDEDFDEMDGQVFTRARAIERQLEKVSRRRKSATPGHQHGGRTGWPHYFLHPPGPELNS